MVNQTVCEAVEPSISSRVACFLRPNGFSLTWPASHHRRLQQAAYPLERSPRSRRGRSPRPGLSSLRAGTVAKMCRSLATALEFAVFGGLRRCVLIRSSDESSGLGRIPGRGLRRMRGRARTGWMAPSIRWRWWSSTENATLVKTDRGLARARPGRDPPEPGGAGRIQGAAPGGGRRPTPRFAVVLGDWLTEHREQPRNSTATWSITTSTQRRTA